MRILNSFLIHSYQLNACYVLNTNSSSNSYERSVGAESIESSEPEGETAFNRARACFNDFQLRVSSIRVSESDRQELRERASNLVRVYASRDQNACLNESEAGMMMDNGFERILDGYVTRVEMLSLYAEKMRLGTFMEGDYEEMSGKKYYSSPETQAYASNDIDAVTHNLECLLDAKSVRLSFDYRGSKSAEILLYMLSPADTRKTGNTFAYEDAYGRTYEIECLKDLFGELRRIGARNMISSVEASPIEGQFWSEFAEQVNSLNDHESLEVEVPGDSLKITRNKDGSFNFYSYGAEKSQLVSDLKSLTNIFLERNMTHNSISIERIYL